jgi:alpha-D-ribose 1-methylphosphonate 5-triphosphate diphosphatase
MDERGRSLDRGHRLCETVAGFRDEGLVRHELHLRCELPEEGSVGAVEVVLHSREVGIVSVMDHTPG